MHAKANALLQKGGSALKESNFSAAVAAYKEALQALEAAGDTVGAATVRRLYAGATCLEDVQTLHHTIAAGKVLSIKSMTDIDPQFETMCTNGGSPASADSARDLLKTAPDAYMRQAAKQPPATQPVVPISPNRSPASAPVVPTSPNQQSVSCSDITGTNSGGPRSQNCDTGNSLVEAARAVRTKNPSAAAETYKQAADAYRRAGDIALANTILQEILSLVLPSQSTSSAAMCIRFAQDLKHTIDAGYAKNFRSITDVDSQGRFEKTCTDAGLQNVLDWAREALAKAQPGLSSSPISGPVGDHENKPTPSKFAATDQIFTPAPVGSGIGDGIIFVGP